MAPPEHVGCALCDLPLLIWQTPGQVFTAIMAALLTKLNASFECLLFPEVASTAQLYQRQRTLEVSSAACRLSGVGS